MSFCIAFAFVNAVGLAFIVVGLLPFLNRDGDVSFPTAVVAVNFLFCLLYVEHRRRSGFVGDVSGGAAAGWDGDLGVGD